MKYKEKQATVLETGQKIKVYKSSLRGTWINSKDLETEYTEKELKIN